MAGNEKRMNPADSAGTDGAIEGQSPAENSTNRVSHATRAAEQAKQKQIAATKQAETTLVVATPFHSTTSCTIYSLVNSASSTFPSSLAT